MSESTEPASNADSHPQYEHPFFGPVISAYSRAQAIEDGILVDVSETAREARITYPVAITRAAYETYVAWTDDDTARTGTIQDESGRLWDVLWMFRAAARKQNGSRIAYSLYVVSRENGGEAQLVHLKAVCGPGDTPEPAITIMLPSED
jgi:hypothetical protein